MVTVCHGTQCHDPHGKLVAVNPSFFFPTKKKEHIYEKLELIWKSKILTSCVPKTQVDSDAFNHYISAEIIKYRGYVVLINSQMVRLEIQETLQSGKKGTARRKLRACIKYNKEEKR